MDETARIAATPAWHSFALTGGIFIAAFVTLKLLG